MQDNSINSLSLDRTHWESEPTLILNKQITQSTVVSNPCGQDTESTTRFVHSNVARPSTNSEEQEGDSQEEKQCDETEIATKGANAVTGSQYTLLQMRFRATRLTEA